MDTGATGQPDLAASFLYSGVATAYQHRPPYPPEVFDVLVQLITDRPRTVLDLGAGEGALARPLAELVDRVDALDVSEAMVAAGQRRPGGGHQNLRWIVGAVESARLDGPYALVTAGASMHWMNLKLTLPRLAAAMSPGAYLAIVEHGARDDPWRSALADIIRRHSRSNSYDAAFEVIGALSASGRWAETGRVRTAPAPFRQRVADYIEALHSTSSLARELMPAEESADFDGAVEEVVAPYADDGVLELTVVADIAWGTIVAGETPGDGR
ncbi:MAG TPA: class I SAM-dependent methyltransferase [Streptosporangiaceae bacterium]|nr:class I SAM-dependent methyltransferase [Streptosporangiaceae bacterium]